MRCPNNKQSRAAFSIETTGDNDKEINFMRDTWEEVGHVHDMLVDPRCIIKGEHMALYTVIGQPFVAKVAEVYLDIPECSGGTSNARCSSRWMLDLDVLRKGRTMCI